MGLIRGPVICITGGDRGFICRLFLFESYDTRFFVLETYCFKRSRRLHMSNVLFGKRSNNSPFHPLFLCLPDFSKISPSTPLIKIIRQLIPTLSNISQREPIKMAPISGEDKERTPAIYYTVTYFFYFYYFYYFILLIFNYLDHPWIDSFITTTYFFLLLLLQIERIYNILLTIYNTSKRSNTTDYLSVRCKRSKKSKNLHSVVLSYGQLLKINKHLVRKIFCSIAHICLLLLF